MLLLLGVQQVSKGLSFTTFTALSGWSDVQVVKSIIVATGHSYVSPCQVVYYIVQTCMIRMHPGSQDDGICSELDTPADLADFDPMNPWVWQSLI